MTSDDRVQREYDRISDLLLRALGGVAVYVEYQLVDLALKYLVVTRHRIARNQVEYVVHVLLYEIVECASAHRRFNSDHAVAWLMIELTKRVFDFLRLFLGVRQVHFHSRDFKEQIDWLVIAGHRNSLIKPTHVRLLKWCICDVR